MKNLLSSIILTIGMLSCASCTDLMKDDGSRGFANVATIVGDAENGFYCYQRHYAGLVVSHSKELAGKERGYFNFYYTEDDWTTSTNGMKYIDNAQVYTIEAYETVHPLTQEEADAGHITGNENCTIPPIIVYRLCLLRLCGFTGRILHLQPHKRRNPQRRSESGIRRNQAGTGHAQTATLLQSAHSRRMDKNKPSLPYRIMRYLFSIFSPTMERFADPRH